MKVLQYLKARLDERSTWLLIGGAVTAASALPTPWSILSVVVGVIAALVPDGSVRP